MSHKIQFVCLVTFIAFINVHLSQTWKPLREKPSFYGRALRGLSFLSSFWSVAKEHFKVDWFLSLTDSDRTAPGIGNNHDESKNEFDFDESQKGRFLSTGFDRSLVLILRAAVNLWEWLRCWPIERWYRFIYIKKSYVTHGQLYKHLQNFVNPSVGRFERWISTFLFTLHFFCTYFIV